MSPLAVFFSGFALASLDLLGLWAFARSLGRTRSGLATALLLFFLVGKFGLLALAIRWISKQPGFEAKALLVGLLLPFIAFVALEFKRAFKKN